MRLLRNIFILFLIPQGFAALAQKTQVNTDPILHYNRGLDLYDKEKFAAAIPEFETYLKEGKEFELKINTRFYLAFCAMELGNNEAEQLIINVLEDHPDHPKANYARFLMGRLYYAKNSFTQVIEYLERVNLQGLSPEETNEYRFILGYSYFSKTKYDEAVTQLEKIKTNKDKYYYPTNYYLGYIAMTRMQDDIALSYFSLLGKSKVYSEKVTVYIARIYYRKGAYADVISYTDTLPTSPQSADIDWERGKAFYQQGKYPEATASFKKGRGTRELSAEDKYMIGMAYYHQKDWENAYLNFTTISSNSDTLKQSALVFAADCFLKLDKKSNARNAFYEASRLNFNAELKELALFNYAKLTLEVPSQQDATNVLKQFIDTYPNSEYSDEAKSLLSEAFLTARRYSDAIPVLESIRDKNEKTKRIYQEITYHYANELLSGNKLPEAEIYFNKARTYPVNARIDAQVDFWLGEIWYNEGRIADAQGSWKKFVNNPESKSTNVYNDGFYNLGYTFFDQKNYTQALNQFKKYTDLEVYSAPKAEKYLDGMSRLADCYFKLKDYSNAAESYAFITSKDAANSDYAYFQTAMLRGAQNRLDEKIQNLKKITSRYPSSEYVDDALYEIALVHLQKQNYTEALRGFSFLLEDYPTGPYAKKSYLNKGLINYNLKKYQDALSDYKAVVYKFPKDEYESRQAMEAIEDIYNELGEGEQLLNWLKDSAKVHISVSYEDSTIYMSALKRYNEKNCEGSITAFKDYLKRFPKAFFATEARFYLSECLYQKEKYDEALDGYLNAINESYPEFIEISYKKASFIYRYQKKYDLAIPFLQQLERIASSKDNKIFAQVNQMYLHYELKNYESAKISAERVLENEKAQKTDLRDANLIVGNVYIQQEEWAKARPYFEKVEKDKENKNAKGAEAMYNLCLIEYKTGSLKKSLELCEQLDKKYANQIYWVAKSYILSAEIYLDQKDKFNARAILQSIIDNYPEKNDGILEKANALMPRTAE